VDDLKGKLASAEDTKRVYSQSMARLRRELESCMGARLEVDSSAKQFEQLKTDLEQSLAREKEKGQ
jgi:hypothetical protein